MKHDPVLNALHEARHQVTQEAQAWPSRAMSVCLTHLETSILWREEDLRLKSRPAPEVPVSDKRSERG